ncbi:unnamed protein product [Vicia faba]|uniref:Protein kinase domain-containing protein n=1 Tax=Vicia faba TaxID=3906 RepID=A0AAV1B6V9_VICFA|nr:unnamed protein product [Vicia faba]
MYIQFSNHNFLLMLLSIFLLLNFIIPKGSSLSFNFTSFDPNDKTIIYNGSAIPASSTIQLTINQQGKQMNRSIGSHAFSTNFPMEQNHKESHRFHISFHFYNRFTEKARLWRWNCILSCPLGPFVAVEFDIFTNEWDPHPAHEHAGIDIHSVKSVANSTWLADIKNGGLNEDWINYNASSLNLNFICWNLLLLISQLPWEVHSISSWDFSSTLEPEQGNNKTITAPSSKKKKAKTGLAVGLGIGRVVLIYEHKLGHGGFGGVYRGFLKDTKSYVAIKRVSEDSHQGIKEFASEVTIISKLRHRNLVQLIGWCHERKKLLLVYEYMPNGSLDIHLFKKQSFLKWAVRYTIAKGLASALLYLHEEWEQCVIHRDIKASNIMLDSEFNAKLGDFGLARFVDHGKGAQTTALAGTMGYLAPECATIGRASKETDVYSFGIVALEIACGRRPVNIKAQENEVHIVEWVWGLYGRGRILEAVDPRLSGDFDEEQIKCLMIVGLWCAHPDPNNRTSMRQAIQVLNFEASLPNLPSSMPVPTYAEGPFNSFTAPFSISGSEEGQSKNIISFSSNTNSTTSDVSPSVSLLYSR